MVTTALSIGTGEVLQQCREEGRAALIGYLPVGFPDVTTSVAAMRVLVESGVDIVEVGIPYTDPLMDGAVIQHAASTALERGVRVDDVFTATAAVREAGAPPMVMTYWNLVLHRGVRAFAERLADGGGAGLITPDLIPDEAAEWIAVSDALGLDRAFLVAPSSTDERLAWVTSQCRGFVYAASTMGVTGARATVGDSAQRLVTRARAVTSLPICVGLGVSSREQAAQVAGFADGVIVGSALVKTLSGPDPDESLTALGALATALAAGVREGR